MSDENKDKVADQTVEEASAAVGAALEKLVRQLQDGADDRVLDALSDELVAKDDSIEVGVEDESDEFGEQDAVSTQLKTVDQKRIGILAQAYVGPDGKKLLVGDNRDGYPIFVAAHPVTGLPWVDSRDRNVVVDPQTGHSFVQYEFKSPVIPGGHPRFTTADINAVAAKKVSRLDDGFLAFVDWLVLNPPLSPEEVKRRAIRPWDGVNRRAKRVLGFFVRITTAFFMAFYNGLLRVERAIDRVRFRKQIAQASALDVKEEKGFNEFLDPISRSLMATPIKSTLYVDPSSGEVYESRLVAMTTPMTPAGEIKPEYAKRFCKLLNRLASEGVWKKGTLAPLSSIHLANAGAFGEGDGQPLFRYSKSLFAMIHVRQDITNDELNRKYAAGLPVFVTDGMVPMSADWKTFPY